MAGEYFVFYTKKHGVPGDEVNGMQEIVMIAAADESWGIGSDGKIPWDVPADRALFKSMTMGHAMIMGRRTFESIGARPLSGRGCAVLTREPQKIRHTEQCFASNNIEELLHWCANFPEPIMVIGGASVYELMMSHASKIFISRIPGKYVCDTFFPEIQGFILKKIDKMDGFNLEQWERHRLSCENDDRITTKNIFHF